MFSKLSSRTFSVNYPTSPKSRPSGTVAAKHELVDLDRLYEHERHSEFLLSDDTSSAPTPTLPPHECVLTPTYATRSAEGLAKSIIGNKVADPMTATLFEQRAAYFLANNKKDQMFTVDCVGIADFDDSLEDPESESSSPVSARSNFFSSASSSSSAEDFGSESEASIGTIASSADENDEIYHTEKPIKIHKNNIIVESQTERINFSEEDSERILSSSPEPFETILDSSMEKPLPMSLNDPATLANVSQDGTSIVVKTGPSGFFQDNIIIPDTCIGAWSAKDTAHPRMIKIKASPSDESECSETCYGLVNLLEPTGISVVSDIDDTIKDTQVLAGAKTVLRNTFFKAARPVDGMANTYKSLYDQGLDFHYVSNSPFQLVSMLKDFLHENNFPLGSFHLRMSGNPFSRLTETPGQAKRESVLQILKDFPERKFIFIGDSGEIDLEIYARIAREYPGRVIKIFIRDVTTAHMHRKLAKSKPYSSDSAPASPKMPLALGNRRLSLGRQSSSNSASPRLEGESYPLNSPTISTRSLPRNNSFTSLSSTSPTTTTKRSIIDLFHERIKKAQADLPEGLIVLFDKAEDISSNADVKEVLTQLAENTK
ncbi:hypothetical protein INT43_001167 [Umbelopsis isabellina]|uniref:Phosphatidate phosphatase APP1 catalytic domain-containing protein n=1 Tax=Mortierella isabellina TaxID=91625 RepID=A0A8H7UAA9_MORIS|nr:hypothetical protein INT43_001167 [Umbelopsis isabellina]